MHLPTSTWTPGGDSVSMLALRTNVLANPRPGVLVGQSAYGEDGFESPLLWPAGFTAEELPDGGILVRDANGEPSVRVGELFSVGGGVITNPDGTQVFKMTAWPRRVDHRPGREPRLPDA
jgi:hypothetical protein